MLEHRARLGYVLVLVSVLGLSGGCGSEAKPLSPEDAADYGRRSKLSELGELLFLYKGDFKKAPKTVADLARFEGGFQLGYLGVKNGDVVLLWGAPIQEGASDKILAYEKSAPESGGYVLMQDGATVKMVTADEFKAAPKAPGTASSGKAAK